MKTFFSRAIALLLALMLFAAPVLAVPDSGTGRLALLEEISELLDEYALYISGDLSLKGITAAMLEADDNLFFEIVKSWQKDDRYGNFFTRAQYMQRYASELLYGIGIVVDVSMPLGIYVESFLDGGGAELR